MPDNHPRGRISSPIDNPSDQSDDNTRHEKNTLITERYKALNDSLIQDIGERKKYAGKLYRLTVAWMSTVVIILVLDSCVVGKWLCFDMSDSVLIALITTTTIGVLGLLHTALKYLFPSKRKQTIR